MAELPAATLPEVAASERDVLLATKLHVPGSRPGLVPRPRLAERLDEGLARGLMLVCAPAGYGKTALLADWARRGQQPVAWLSLDVGDNDPARFWRHGVAALDQGRPGLAERVGPLLGPPAPASYEGLVTALINELAAEPDADQALLVLDDYHLIDSEAVHASLGFLLEHRPPGLPLVLASRSDPPLALARLRARGQLAELRADQLRFTADEAAELLRQGTAVSGVALPETAVAALAARTEGWAAGLQLASLSLRGQPDTAGFTAALTGSHRYVLDFLAEEVLEHQSEQVRTFLLETSVLERLSGELCDTVTGRPGSQALLEQVERAGLFLTPLDEVRGWWRYHHLFADLLRARLQAEQPRRVAQLHRNAAAWCQEHGLADDAIRHAVAAGEMASAAGLVEQHFDALVYLHGEDATIQRWISALPGELVRSRPRLLLAQSFLASYSGQLEAVEPLLDAAERASPGWADEPFEPTVGRARSLLVNIPALIALRRSFLAQLRGDAEATVAFASRAMAESGEDEWLLGLVARWNLAAGEWLRGRVAEAEGVFVACIPGWRALGQPTLTAWVVYQLGQVQRAQGRLDAAVETFERALHAATAPGRESAPALGLVYVGLAEVAYQRNELDSALRYVTEGITLCRPFVYKAPLAAGLATLAWIRQATGDPAGALEAIGEAEYAWRTTADLLNPFPSQRARLLLAQGDVAAAARWTHESGLRAGDEPHYPREPGYLLLARVLLAQQRPAEALALLDRLRAAAVAQDRVGSVIEVGALRALALAACGQDADAMNALADVLTLACPQGYVRVFADEGPPMAALLGRLIAAQRADAPGVPLGCLARLQRAFGAGPPAPGSGRDTVAVPGIVNPLTSRELEVLAMLAAGRPNQSIAGELFVTLDTVKKHVSHLLGKLGAANRTEAVTRARELGLIP
ncbi:MAG TPA: LuxR C-terminal-related transcriptional regulator [Streptosporangiaceae bacterium]|nr:LuxR C-terminal-related transcriptional regulator [Streptosporangiaceae bacterium]